MGKQRPRYSTYRYEYSYDDNIKFRKNTYHDGAFCRVFVSGVSSLHWPSGTFIVSLWAWPAVYNESVLIGPTCEIK